MKLDNETYYDAFADWYERERHHGYHKVIDDIEVGLIERHCRDREVLEVGCGTGAILKRVAPHSKRAVGLDLSRQMLLQAHARGLSCVQGSATALPFANESFDLVYSYKVLAHIEDILCAMREVARVLRPGGDAFLEFYNPRSLRYLSKTLAGPGAIASDQTRENHVYVRWDTPKRAVSYLPASLTPVGAHGVRLFTPAAPAHKLPVVGQILGVMERWGATQSKLASLGGFYVIHARKA